MRPGGLHWWCWKTLDGIALYVAACVLSAVLQTVLTPMADQYGVVHPFWVSGVALAFLVVYLAARAVIRRVRCT